VPLSAEQPPLELSSSTSGPERDTVCAAVDRLSGWLSPGVRASSALPLTGAAAVEETEEPPLTLLTMEAERKADLDAVVVVWLLLPEPPELLDAVERVETGLEADTRPLSNELSPESDEPAAARLCTTRRLLGRTVLPLLDTPLFLVSLTSGVAELAFSANESKLAFHLAEGVTLL